MTFHDQATRVEQNNTEPETFSLSLLRSHNYFPSLTDSTSDPQAQFFQVKFLTVTMKFFLTTSFLLIILASTTFAVEEKTTNIRGGAVDLEERNLKGKPPSPGGGGGGQPNGKAIGFYCCKPHKNEDACDDWAASTTCQERIQEQTPNDFDRCEWKNNKCQGVDK